MNTDRALSPATPAILIAAEEFMHEEYREARSYSTWSPMQSHWLDNTYGRKGLIFMR